MAPWLMMLAKQVIAPLLVDKGIDLLKEQLEDKEVDDAISAVSQVAQKLSAVKNCEMDHSPKGHLDEDTKTKALEVVNSALDILDMIEDMDIDLNL